MSTLWITSMKDLIDEASIDRGAHLHGRVSVQNIREGDLVRPLHPPQAPFERADGVLHDTTHPFDPCNEDFVGMGPREDYEHMYCVKFPRYFGPHAPEGTRFEVYRPKES